MSEKKIFDITGRKALVTGASRGIGRSIARILHANGAYVGLHGTKLDKLESLANELGERVKIFPADLSNRACVKELGQKAEEELGGIDILVNNAGITKDGLCLRMSDEAWDTLLEVNLTAVFCLTREILAPMVRRRFGRIINISSIVAETGNPGQVNYCAAKAGLIGFSKSLARETASRSITVNCVAPGFIETEMTSKLDEKRKEAILSTIPLQRMGIDEDIAFAVAYLASNEAGYVTGQTLHVNGGMAMV